MEEVSSDQGFDDFAQRSSDFVTWFSNLSDTRLSPKIKLTDLRLVGAGRGVVATEDIQLDEELFAIPRSIVITASTSSIPPEILEPLKDAGAWLPLIATIIHEYLKGKGSLWYGYFQVLPRSFDTLMFWTDAQLAELQASAVISKIGKDSAEELWRNTIIPVMLENHILFPVVGNTNAEKAEELIRLAHFAGSLIMAYGFDIDRDDDKKVSGDDTSEEEFEEDDEEEPLKGMVPLADMLNADADLNNARLFQEDDFLIMKATKLIRAGEQIFNDYGPLPRSDLLRMYGYVTNSYAQHDVVEFEHDLLVDVAGMKDPGQNQAWLKRQEQLDELGLIDDGYSLPRPSKDASLEAYLPGTMHMLLRGLCLDESSTKVKLHHQNHQEMVSIREAALLSAVATMKLSEYSTTLQHDQSQLTKSDMSNTTPDLQRYRMALQVRVGEKEILQSLIHLCQTHIKAKTIDIANNDKKRKLENGHSTTSKKTAKRRG